MSRKIIKEFLMAPGPTPVPAEVLQVGAMPLYHHRTPRFSKLFGEASEMLKPIFSTAQPVYTIASSGSGVMETAVANLFSPGDTVICLEAGKFGERWTKICKAYSIKTVVVKVEYGDAVTPEMLKEALAKNPDAKAVLTQLSETSTGCVHDIEAMGKIVASTNAIFVVDGISGIGAQEMHMDAWQVDVALTGSQKGLMLPPGLGFIAVSPKAWKLVESATSPRFYFDLRMYRKSLEKSDTPWTPATTLIIQLKKALEMIHEETVEGMWNRHAWLADATRSAISAMELEFFAKRPGNVLTSVKVPAGIDGGALVKTIRDQFGVTLAGGQGDEMKGKIFRVAHLGYMDRSDIIVAISAIEMVLKRMGHPVTLGRGVAAAEAILLQEPSEYRSQR